MAYVDGFVLPVPKDKLAEYRKMARFASKIWMEYGALEYVETVADDVKPGKWTSFPQAVKQKPGETVVLSWAVFPSKKARDRANARIMADPRFDEYMKKGTMPFDGKRMFWGGFKPFISVRKS
jgi:uncharacterized protein YbaA (DUF1428 family)